MPSLTTVSPLGSTVSASEVESDVATQPELDAVSTRVGNVANAAGRRGQAGSLVNPWGFGSISTVAFAAARATFVRFTPAEDLLVVSVGYNLSGAAVGNVDVGIMDETGARLRSSGAVAGKLTNVGGNDVALSSALQLVAGTDYYVGATPSTTTPTFRALSVAHAEIATVFGGTIGTADAFYMDTQVTIPAQATLTGTGNSTWPLFWVKT